MRASRPAASGSRTPAPTAPSSPLRRPSPRARSSRTRTPTRRSRRSSRGWTRGSCWHERAVRESHRTSCAMSRILVYALHYEGAFNKNSLGAVSEGARLAGELGTECHAIVVGEGIGDDLASQLGNYGATKVYRVEGPEGLAQPVVDAMAAAIAAGGHEYALFGGGLLGFENGAGLTARVDARVVMEVTEVRVEDGKLVAERPILK